MTLSIEQIATAISRHSFEDAYPYLLDDVRWRLVDGEDLEGKAAVVATCETSARYLSGVMTRFDKFVVRAMDNCVVIESVATYSEPGGDTSVVASCDIYDFTSGKLSTIASYNIELEGNS